MGSKIYLPGSTLKGIFRSHIEKVINSIKPQVAYNPLSRRGDNRDDRQLYRPFCAHDFKDWMSKAEIYK